MHQNISLGNDLAPRDFRMKGFEFLGYFSRSFADDLGISLNSITQYLISGKITLRFALHETLTFSAARNISRR